MTTAQFIIVLIYITCIFARTWNGYDTLNGFGKFLVEVGAFVVGLILYGFLCTIF